MFRKGKAKIKRDHSTIDGERGSRSTCPVFGFPCSRPLAARFRTLSARLQVPIYQIGEQAMENMIGLVDSMTPEECQEQRLHLLEHHGIQRMIDHLEAYDRETSDMLKAEWKKRYQNEYIVHQIVDGYVKRGMRPESIRGYIDLGVRYMNESGGRKQGPPTT
jgi:hypothetical protein